MEKIKVVWICHLSSEEIRSHLHLSKRRVENYIRHLSGRRKGGYYDFSLWNVYGAKEFEHIHDVELHVISPHAGMRRTIEEFQMNGVFYHFFRKELPFPFNQAERKLRPKQYIEFPRNRELIQNFIHQIRPDIVNLIGAEHQSKRPNKILFLI